MIGKSGHRVIGKAKPLTTKDTRSTPSRCSVAQGRLWHAKENPEAYANLGCAGMIQVKYFEILVEAQGEGVTIAVIADIAGIARNRKGKTVNH